MCSNSQDNYSYFQCTQLLEFSRRLVEGPIRPHTHKYTHTASGKFYTSTENLDCGDKYKASGGNQHILTLRLLLQG